MSSRVIQTVLLSILGLGATVYAADPYAGNYKGDTLSVEIAPAAEGYSGTIHLGKEAFPMKAAVAGQQLQGAFASGGAWYKFTASRQDDTLMLTSEGATYIMKRQSTPNPLGNTGNQRPDQAQVAPGDVPKGYNLVKATAAGKSMTVEKAGVTNVRDALNAVMDDLDDFFDDDWDVNGSFEDQKTHRAGMALIAAKHKGQPVKGFIAVQLKDKGAVGAVIFCNPKATRAEWAELTANSAPVAKAGVAPQPGVAPAPAADAAMQAAVSKVQLKEYRFPDGTGSVGIPEGWHTDAKSGMGGVQIDGPAGQRVYLGCGYAVNTPNSMAVQMARQYGTGGIMLLVSPFVEPAEALIQIAPQLSAFEKQAGRPGLEIDHVQKVRDLTPMQENSHFAVISYGVTKSLDGKRPQHYQSLAQISTAPISNDSWQFWFNQALAPDATAKEDMPVMIAIINSLRSNDKVIQAKTDAWVADRGVWFQQQQAAHNDQVATFDKQNEQWRKDSNERSRRNADFDELIRGYREVEDSRTGEKTTVDLGNADEAVRQLNEGGTADFKQIPLRDRVAPEIK